MFWSWDMCVVIFVLTNSIQQTQQKEEDKEGDVSVKWIRQLHLPVIIIFLFFKYSLHLF